MCVDKLELQTIIVISLLVVLYFYILGCRIGKRKALKKDGQ